MSTDSYMTMKKRMKKQREDDFPMLGSVESRREGLLQGREAMKES